MLMGLSSQPSFAPTAASLPMSIMAGLAMTDEELNLHQLDATRDESNLIGWAANRVQAEFGEHR